MQTQSSQTEISLVWKNKEKWEEEEEVSADKGSSTSATNNSPLWHSPHSDAGSRSAAVAVRDTTLHSLMIHPDGAPSSGPCCCCCCFSDVPPSYRRSLGNPQSAVGLTSTRTHHTPGCWRQGPLGRAFALHFSIPKLEQQPTKTHTVVTLTIRKFSIPRLALSSNLFWHLQYPVGHLETANHRSDILSQWAKLNRTTSQPPWKRKFDSQPFVKAAIFRLLFAPRAEQFSSYVQRTPTTQIITVPNGIKEN